MLLQPDGAPASRVQVQFDPADFGTASPVVTTQTDESGAFHMLLASGLTLPPHRTLTLAIHPSSAAAPPTTIKDTAWPRLTNVTGLVAGSTRLGDELNLLYPVNAIVTSIFAGDVERVWDGSSFVTG